MPHVFMSYVSENKEQVLSLCETLTNRGVHVWLDRNKISPGIKWKEAIRNAIQVGDFFIACFSQEYSSRTKTYMNEELTLAIEELRQYSRTRPWFIPVRLSNCDIPDIDIGSGQSLRDIQWVDIFEDWESGIEKILSVIQPANSRIPYSTKSIRFGSSVRELSHIDKSLSLIALAEASQDSDKSIRGTVANNLSEIEGITKSEAIALLAKLIQDNDPEVRYSAVNALGNWGPPLTHDFMQILKDGLRDGEIKIQQATIHLIEKFLQNEDMDFRNTAVQALLDVGIRDPEVLTKGLLTISDDNLISRIEKTLSQSGSAQKQIVPIIERIFSVDRYDSPRTLAALKILEKIIQAEQLGHESEGFIRIIVERTHDGYYPHSMYYYEKILHKIAGPGVQFIIPRMIDQSTQPGFQDPPYSYDPKVHAKRVLEIIGPWAYQMLLKERSKHEKGSTLFDHINKLIDMIYNQLKTKEAVPALIYMLKDKDVNIREVALKKLGDIGSGAKDAVPTLMKILDDNDESISSAAKEALEKILEKKVD